MGAKWVHHTPDEVLSAGYNYSLAITCGSVCREIFR